MSGELNVGFAVAGEGVPIVFLHAFPLDAQMWRPLVGELAAHGVSRSMIALDFPGFGPDAALDGLPQPPSLEAIADGAVAAVVRLTGDAAATWIGCSMGGYVALAIVERHPAAVAGLGLIDTRASADDTAGRARRLAAAAAMDIVTTLPDPRGMAEPLVGRQDAGRDAIVDLATAIVAEQRPAAVAWGQRAMAARPDRASVLEHCDVPAAVLWGELDQVTAHADAQAMASALGVEVAVLAGVGHLSPIEAPDAVAAALVEMLVGG